MWSTFLAAKDIWNIFLKTIDYVKNLEIKHIVEGGAGGEGWYYLRHYMTRCVRKSICNSPLNAVNYIFSYQIVYRIYKSTAKHKSNPPKKKKSKTARRVSLSHWYCGWKMFMLE